MKLINIIATIILCSLSIFPLTQTKNEEFLILQTGKKILIDGNLDDWEGIREFPVYLTPDGEKVDISSDIKVTARFTYDSKNFYAAVKAVDDIFEFPNRNRRYGDGLYLTFVDPYQGNEGDRFYTFGFSRQDKENVKVLVNKDGTYFPRIAIYDVELKVIPDKNKKSIVYEISIPFKYIVPFKPFIHGKWGINLIYIDRDQDKLEVLQLYSDKNYDTELSKRRKGLVFNFVNHAPEEPEFQSSMNATHFYHDKDITVSTVVNSPINETGWKILYKMSSAGENVSKTQNISLEKGINTFTYSLEKKDYPSGIYDLSVGVINNKGSLKFSENNTFFILNRNDLEKEILDLSRIKAKNIFKEKEEFRNSIPTLEIRYEWIKEYMNKTHPFAEMGLLERWYQEKRFLREKVEQDKPSLFPEGRAGRLAHRSSIDGTLQPYSVYIPDDYNKKTPIPLFVTLHGSGVDEENTVINMARTYLEARMQKRVGKMIILAPKGRGLSDFYTGDSGEDVIECINHLKTLYNIDEENIIIDGFSMGGYGAWRLGLLHPDLFKAVIIRSGAVSVPNHLNGENILNLIKKRSRQNFFIVHGDQDNAVPVENAREVVKKLKELKIKHSYIEVKGAAHGGYNKWNEIFKWLERILRSKK